MKNQFLLVISIFGIFLFSCQQQSSNDQLHDELHSIFEEEWKFRTSENNNIPDTFIAEMPKFLPEAQNKRSDFWKEILQKLEKIDRDQLTQKDRINYDIFKYQLEDKIARIGFEDYLMPLNSEGGFFTRFAQMPDWMPFKNREDFDNYLARLATFQQYTDDHIELMRTGIKKGITQPKVIMEKYKSLINPILAESVLEGRFFRPLKEMGDNIPKDAQRDLKKQAETIIAEKVMTAYRKFDEFMEKEYIPNCREDLGASTLPNGKAYYEQRVQFFTTLPVTSDDIFKKGQEEVARIRADMQQVIADVGFKGSFADFINFLRTDEQFYAKSPKALLMEASYLAKKMDGKLPDFFNSLPRLPYGVQPVPAALAPNYTGGRYSGGSYKNHRAGNYWVNTYKLESRPLYVLPALTLHEAVPGHHLQISLAQELEGFPEFRKNTYLSCYGEGWGLYSEYLGIEAGMYETPYENFGRMTYEMWRACRLVVDVWIHAKGWTREQAVEFLGSNTALSLHEVNTEIDRYIGWPGQALSYKMGELKIRELRKKAEKELGEKFDIRDFHDVVLLNGAVPLFVLDELVNDYIKAAGS